LTDGNDATLEAALEGEGARALLEPWGPEAIVVSAEAGWGLDEVRRTVEAALVEAAAATG
jgi:hypothetical protein